MTRDQLRRAIDDTKARIRQLEKPRRKRHSKVKQAARSANTAKLHKYLKELQKLDKATDTRLDKTHVREPELV